MEDSNVRMIDDSYEFSAPRFFDFIKEESVEDVRKAELWFDGAPSYAPSPFMPKIKTSRTVKIESLCDFSEDEQLQKLQASESLEFVTTSESTITSNFIKESTLEPEKKQTRPQSEFMPAVIREEIIPNIIKEIRPQSEFMSAVIREEIIPNIIKEIREEVTPNDSKEENSTSLLNLVSADEKKCEAKEEGVCTKDQGSVLTGGTSSSTLKADPANEEDNMSTAQGTAAYTPKPPITSRTHPLLLTDPKKKQTARNIASLVRNPSALKSKNQSQLSHAKNIKPSSVRRDTNLINKVGTPYFAQENQAIKRQKLEGGKSRQILSDKIENLPYKTRPGLISSSFILCSSTAKTHKEDRKILSDKIENLPYKTRPGLISSSSILCSSTAKTHKEDRKIYVREPVAPFVSMAEMIKKFQSNTREMSFSHDAAPSVMQRKSKLTLTRPKEPEFETAQRVRSVRIKSSAELEEEMMEKIPKFKAHPINKKILEASTLPALPALPRCTPQVPLFQEFHFKTMGRANQNAETSTVASTKSAPQNHQWKLHLTVPKEPILQTSLRARPQRIRSSDELEKEELENFPKFKARPLNRKIFESKGALGVFCNTKRQVTLPQEFHFATDERILPPAIVADLFNKLSLHSESHHDKQIPRNTAPNPFHLHTQERGAEKEKKFVMEVIQKQLKEDRARFPNAYPYPCTTDYPVVPPKPEPKHCTEPEPFQLESLVRHEEDMQTEMEERWRMEKEEAEMRRFKAQPILKEDPIPVLEKIRKPLTQVQDFNLHVEHRAVNRAEFDKKIEEKETMYKRYREEAESEKMMEEEKALKQLRRTLVPHARPVPQFDRPFLPQKSSKEVTKPKSPKLKVLLRKERREMICAVAAASSAASHMR